jgi:hypothetical protein
LPLTAAELVLRATRKARGGLSPAESRIFDDNAYLLIKDALTELATRAAKDSKKRWLLMRSFTLTFTDGAAPISGALFDGLLKEYLCYAFLYEPGDDQQVFPYHFINNLQDLRGYQHPVFGHWALSDQSTIRTRARNVGGEGALTALNGEGALRAIYIPDFSGNNPLPAEFDDWAVEILSDLLIANRPPAKK